ncbi:MAG TPA: DUF4157 domain-containing protein [Blastocatellia bacterium]|nr:DUF4157 domain-containing protein [Blastocatellia bacterium]
MNKRGRIFRADPAKAQSLPDHVKTILAPYFPGFDLDQIRIHEGIPFYVTMDATAYTDGNNIFFKPGAFNPDSIEGIALIGHEVTHSVQFQRHGKWRFRASYLTNWGKQYTQHRNFGHAYYYNEFEIEARAMEDRIFSDLLLRQMEHG